MDERDIDAALDGKRHRGSWLTKVTAGVAAGLTVAGEVLHGHGHLAHEGGHPHHPHDGGGPAPEPRVFHKAGVDSPEDVAARRFDALLNQDHARHELHR